MSHDFDEQFWESHWRDAGSTDAPNPHLLTELVDLVPGTALDAGCGEGAEAVWLAERGWRVTAIDISATALARAWARAAARGLADRVEWAQADLTTWVPEGAFDLVTTHYAHPAMPQADFYERVAGWVAPGGTLLVVGHRDAGAHDGHGHEHGSAGRSHDHAGGAGNHGEPPTHATTSSFEVRDRFLARGWEVVVADERVRGTSDADGRPVTLHDVVVRVRRPGAGSD